MGRVLAVVMAGAMIAVAGCASPPRSTRLKVEDFDHVVAEVRDSFARHLTGRGPGSPQMRLLTVELQNQSSDVLSRAEKWMAVARVQAAAPVQALLRERNVVFQLPLHQVEALRREGFDLPPADRPTHEFTATLRSATRSGKSEAGGDTDVRKEYYEFEYQVVDLATREVAWSDTVTFAREAAGTVVN
jgi:hypothetical protein